jgi:hypothetical protein
MNRGLLGMGSQQTISFHDLGIGFFGKASWGKAKANAAGSCFSRDEAFLVY